MQLRFVPFSDTALSISLVATKAPLGAYIHCLIRITLKLRGNVA